MRERVALLAKLRDAGWPLSLALAGTLLGGALVPAATAMAMGLLVGTAERRAPVWLPLIVFAGVLLVSYLGALRIIVR